MKHHTRTYTLLATAIIAGATTTARADSVAVTAYNDNFAVITEQRSIHLPAGRSAYEFSDIAAHIEPASVQFVSLTAPDAVHIVEQNFQYDLVSSDALLQRYLDREVAVYMDNGDLHEGTLLGYEQGQLILQNSSGVELIDRTDGVRQVLLNEGTGTLQVTPTLVWMLDNDRSGTHDVRLMYQTGGIQWHTDYSLLVGADGDTIDLDGWVTLTNTSGATYRDAALKLVAGDVNKIEENVPPAPEVMLRMSGTVADMAEEKSFEEKAFAEYHLYTLNRRTTIADRQTKQIDLLAATDVPVQRLYVFDAVESQRYGGRYRYTPTYDQVGEESAVWVYLKFKNSEENNLGMPLPAGTIRLFRDDSQGRRQIVGQDSIEHTPKDEDIRLKLGQANDVTGLRTQTDQRRISSQVYEQSFRIRLRNHKDITVPITVVEHLYGHQNWHIRQASHDYTQRDYRTIEFLVAVDSNREETITYTVRYGGQKSSADRQRSVPTLRPQAEERTQHPR